MWDATLRVSFPLSVPHAEHENSLEVLASVWSAFSEEERRRPVSSDRVRNGFQAGVHLIVSGGLCRQGEDRFSARLVLQAGQLTERFIFHALPCSHIPCCCGIITEF